MKTKPIIFSESMIKSIIDGRKNQTRRIIKPQPKQRPYFDEYSEEWIYYRSHKPSKWKCPYGKPGDLLYVRENLYQEGELGLRYVADREPLEESIIPEDFGPYGGEYTFRTIPNIHMPKWAARIWLQIDDVSVDRVQDISEEDAIAEGVNRMPHRCETSYPNDCHRCAFKILWNQINGPKGYSWNTNPWVWVITSKILSTTGNPFDLNKELAQKI